MFYHEKEMDLLSVPQGYWIAHCVSADFALGAGIAKQIDIAFGMRQMLFRLCGEHGWFFSRYGPSCVPCANVFNLVTKQHYWDKPTIKTLEQALTSMKMQVVETGVTKIAMPMIGCGLDRLDWNDVKPLIKKTFEDIDIEILVCFWRKNGNKT